MRSTLDLNAYLARIRYARPVVVDPATLRAVHVAHVSHIPFENLDIQMGLPIRLDLGALQSKMVGRRRGGYCFEHNTLFHHVLQAMGFEVIACEARVRQGATKVRPRTHMVLLASVDGDIWLCDVGFGAHGLLDPVVVDGESHDQFGVCFRVVAEGAVRVLQAAHGESWEDLYEFAPEPRYDVDFEMANWFVSTHPDSPFVKTLTVQSADPHARRVLRNLRLTLTTRGGDAETRDIIRADLVPILRGDFGLEVPDDARFRALDSGAP